MPLKVITRPYLLNTTGFHFILTFSAPIESKNIEMNNYSVCADSCYTFDAVDCAESNKMDRDVKVEFWILLNYQQANRNQEIISIEYIGNLDRITAEIVVVVCQNKNEIDGNAL